MNTIQQHIPHLETSWNELARLQVVERTSHDYIVRLAA